MLRDDFQNALKEAMKEKNTLKINAVRMIIAGLKEKDVDARGRGKEKADDAELLSMMQTMIKQRQESIKMYIEGNRPELAEKEQAEIKIIEQFLPTQMTETEMTETIKAVISRTQAKSMKDMGRVMGALRMDYAGRMDFAKASEIIKNLLG